MAEKKSRKCPHKLTEVKCDSKLLYLKCYYQTLTLNRYLNSNLLITACPCLYFVMRLFSPKWQVKGATVTNQHTLLGTKPQILLLLKVLISLQTQWSHCKTTALLVERTGIQCKLRYVILDQCLTLSTEDGNYRWGLGTGALKCTRSNYSKNKAALHVNHAALHQRGTHLGAIWARLVQMSQPQSPPCV